MEPSLLPTTLLPPISKIASSSPELLLDALCYLRQVYTPDVRGSRRIKKVSADHDLSLGPQVDHFLPNDIQSDAYERAYAMRWLTALVSHASALELDSDDTESNVPSSSQSAPEPTLASQYDLILTRASSILAISAGTSAAGTITRVFTFGSDTGGIAVTFTDEPLDNQKYESVGAQTWGGACVLSELIVEQPSTFGLAPGPRRNGTRLRLLELGAGTGLVSLTLGKLLESTEVEAEIVATDFFLSVLANLQNNITANSFSSSSSVSVTSHFLNWSTFPNEDTSLPPFDDAFDIVLGADIIYEASHAIWIKACLQKLLRRPTGPLDDSQGVFYLVIPLRPTHKAESQTIEEVFPNAVPISAFSSCTKGLELVILNKEVIVCEARQGKKGEEVEYGYYKIGWAGI